MIMISEDGMVTFLVGGIDDWRTIYGRKGSDVLDKVFMREGPLTGIRIEYYFRFSGSGQIELRRRLTDGTDDVLLASFSTKLALGIVAKSSLDIIEYSENDRKARA